MTGHEIPEDVIEAAARAWYASGPQSAGAWVDVPAWLKDTYRSHAQPPVRIAWAAAREQALAEAEEAAHQVQHRWSQPPMCPDTYDAGALATKQAVAALRRKEGGE